MQKLQGVTDYRITSLQQRVLSWYFGIFYLLCNQGFSKSLSDLLSVFAKGEVVVMDSILYDTVLNALKILCHSFFC